MAIILRPVRGLADMQYNFEQLAKAITNISGEQIQTGSIPAGALAGDYMPKSGGDFSGGIAAPSVKVGAVAVALSTDLANYVLASTLVNYYTKTETDAALALKANQATTYTKAEVDTALAGKASTAAGTTATAGLLKQLASIAALTLTVTNPPTQAEVQSIANKVDALLAEMKARGGMEP